ncbi:hypothetical protein BDZ45DRAFT_699174 [Acephala macrosclerotiorum]|nr:hypothetical protein BDZ45DRAFT_699174 [Acephala macrosclerotiorum]
MVTHAQYYRNVPRTEPSQYSNTSQDSQLHHSGNTDNSQQPLRRDPYQFDPRSAGNAHSSTQKPNAFQKSRNKPSQIEARSQLIAMQQALAEQHEGLQPPMELDPYPSRSTMGQRASARYSTARYSRDDYAIPDRRLDLIPASQAARKRALNPPRTWGQFFGDFWRDHKLGCIAWPIFLILGAAIVTMSIYSSPLVPHDPHGCQTLACLKLPWFEQGDYTPSAGVVIDDIKPETHDVVKFGDDTYARLKRDGVNGDAFDFEADVITVEALEAAGFTIVVANTEVVSIEAVKVELVAIEGLKYEDFKFKASPAEIAAYIAKITGPIKPPKPAKPASSSHEFGISHMLEDVFDPLSELDVSFYNILRCLNPWFDAQSAVEEQTAIKALEAELKAKYQLHNPSGIPLLPEVAKIQQQAYLAELKERKAELINDKAGKAERAIRHAEHRLKVARQEYDDLAATVAAENERFSATVRATKAKFEAEIKHYAKKLEEVRSKISGLSLKIYRARNDLEEAEAAMDKLRAKVKREVETFNKALDASRAKAQHKVERAERALVKVLRKYPTVKTFSKVKIVTPSPTTNLEQALAAATSTPTTETPDVATQLLALQTEMATRQSEHHRIMAEHTTCLARTLATPTMEEVLCVATHVSAMQAEMDEYEEFLEEAEVKTIALMGDI